jgi:predicted esterase
MRVARALAPRSLALVLGLAGLAGVVGLPAASAAPPPPAEVARDLVQGKVGPQDALAAWRAAGVTPADAAGLLAAALPTDRGTPGEQRLTLTDAHGRSTELVVLVPDAPRADGRYGLLVVLHGLRGNARQLLPFARKIAPPGTIIAAPTAQFLPTEQENEDGAALGRAFGLAGASPAPGGDDKADVLAKLLQQAQRAVLPHWWSYGDDGFPLLAVDAIRRRFPLDPDRVELTGYSMGGFGTWGVGLRHPDRFAAIAPLAGGISREEYVGGHDARLRSLLANCKMVPTFFVHGGSDSTVPTRFDQATDRELTALGVEHTYVEVPGAQHVIMPFLRGDALTDQLTAWLAAHVRDPHPRTVEHHVLSAGHGASYWLEIDGVQGDEASATATVEAGNRIVVETHGVTRLTVFLDPTLVDASAPVRLEVDGKVVHDGPVAATLEAVAASFAPRHDPSLVYTRAVEVDLGAATGDTQAPPAPATPAPATPAPAPARRWF